MKFRLRRLGSWVWAEHASTGKCLYRASRSRVHVYSPHYHLLYITSHHTSLLTSMLSLLLALPALVAAHGHVDKVIADGVTYQGWNAALKYQTPIPATVGWQADNLDNGFVTPDRFGSVDIVCHKLGKSNGASVPVKPGSKVTFKW
jgi:hypothetical protein